MTSHRARILGLGTALPRRAIAQDAAAQHALRYCQDPAQARLLATLYRRSGIQARYSVLEDAKVAADGPADFYPVPSSSTNPGPTTSARMSRYTAEAPPLAARAAAAALADARLRPDAITHLVTASCTGFAAPGFDIQLIQSLNLSPSVARTHLGFMGCHAALNALRIAAAFVQADPQARALVCAVELCSLHFAYSSDPQQIVANSLFADGAAAAVVGGSTAEPAPWQILASTSWVLPDTLDVMTWTVGDAGFRMTLSPRLPSLICEHLPRLLPPWLNSQGLSISDIRGWAVHPGGPRVLDAVAETLHLPPDALSSSRAVLAQHGNMSSPTVLFILRELQRAALPGPTLVLAFGPGLTIEAALLDHQHP